MCLGSFLATSMSAHAQGTTFVTPSTNTNLVGTSPGPGDVADLSLKQQQEPSCIVRPNSPAFIFCAYNDLRAADLPLVQGDSWMGVSMSNDFGQTWFSDLAPGYLGHPNSLGMGFAADPSVVAIPGNSPGLALLNYIAAFRDSDNGVFALQRYVEFPREDQDFWKPEDEIHIIADGSEGRFIDKPAFAYIVDEYAQQGTITQQINVEGETQPISVTTPTGTLVAIAAVFTGNSGGSKLLMWKSRDNGVTWGNAQKISEEQNEVTGVSIAAKGQDFVVVYRRRGDNNNSDAIMSAICSNTGNEKCSKGEVAYEICPFDQPASGSTFRTFTFPWAASDGDRFWAFATDRNPGGACVESAAAPGFFEGKPRIVAMSSTDGKNWVGAPGAVDEPFVIAPRADGFQAIPVASGIKGRIDVAWYDTFREEDVGLPAGPNDLLVNDYVADGGFARVWRKADVWMTRLDTSGQGANCSGGGPNAGCMPSIETPVRISQYETFADLATGDVYDIEGHLTGLPLYASGTLAFKGDYIALSGRPLREAQSDKWIANYLPQQSYDLNTFVYEEDVFVAWGDNRDVRADFYPPLVNGGTAENPAPNLDPGTQMPYSPPANSPSASVLIDESQEDGEPVSFKRAGEMVAADEPDDGPAQPGNADILMCAPGADYSRSRDANVYGSLVRDEASMAAPTASKPLGSIQRMFPLILTNVDTLAPKNFCLRIENQPIDYAQGTGLASFYQLPSIAPFEAGDDLSLLDVNVDAGSAAARAVYVSTSNPASVVTVNAYEGFCPVTAGSKLISSVELSDGDLVDPAYCEGWTPITNEMDPLFNDPRNKACVDQGQLVFVDDGANSTETHNITFAAPVLQTPVLQTPTFQIPTFQIPTFQIPTFQIPTFQIPTFQIPTFQIPTFQIPTLQSSNLSDSEIAGYELDLADGEPTTFTYMTDSMEAPTLQADTFGAVAGSTATNDQVYYQDITFPIEAAANVTTTYSADIQIDPELDRDTSEVQMIVWSPNVHATAGQCLAQPAADQQIIAYTQLDDTDLSSLTLPYTISEEPGGQDPYRGAVSFFGQSGKELSVTVRIWAVDNGDPDVPSALQTMETREGDRQMCLSSLGSSPSEQQVLDCENLGTRGLITFGASSHSCITRIADDKTENPTPFDCLDNGTEKLIEDKTGPVISLEFANADSVPGEPGEQFEATGPDGVVVSYTASAIDNLDTNPILSCDPASGTTFGLAAGGGPGAGNIICSASDNASPPNQTITSFPFAVVDTTPPTLTVPDDITVEAAGPTTTVDFGTATAIDLVDTDVDITFENAPMAMAFPVGSTTITWTATDDSGNTATATQLVTVEDNSPPVIMAPEKVTVLAATGGTGEDVFPDAGSDPQTPIFTVEANLAPPDGAAIAYSLSANDAVAGSVGVTCIPSSGSTFPEGDGQSVQCSATDGGGNGSSLTFTINVQDSTNPVFSVEDNTEYSFEAEGPEGAFVDLVNDQDLIDENTNIVATDRGVEIDPVCVATPSGGGDEIILPDFLPPGDYDVVCSVDGVETDPVTVSVIVDIVDNEVPTLTIPAGTATVPADTEVDLLGLIFDTDGDGVGDAGITATDTVDEDVAITCEPGGPFTVGTHTITCTASDDGPNDAGGINTTDPQTFTLNAVFPFGIDLIVPKGQAKAGSTIPVDWVYLDELGDPVDSSGFAPIARWVGRYDTNDCSGTSSGETDDSEDSGSSSIRYSASSKTWQLSWQTPDAPGRYKFIVTPPGENVPQATACVRLR
jgi:hypothetical protein